MTKEDVRKALDEIRAIAKDDEMAHVKEDDLRAELLNSIAAGTCEDPAGCAELALTSDEIEFSRWYA